ncbi:hypothetical protein NFC81_07045 [Salinispirillum sp. LH 10-3-1]|uniref:Uncharacterized protein n=1 Tax=Salinispirillum sp. LH 10-3-1 TaxID=2952525 RepID=A0AB38YJP1_9GAMM
MNDRSPNVYRSTLLMTLLATATLILSGCNDDNDGGGNKNQKEANPRMLTAMKTSPAVDAQTPNALRSETSAQAQSLLIRSITPRDDDGGDDGNGFNAFNFCDGAYGGQAPEEDRNDYLLSACLVSYAMKETFFSGFLTDIRTSLTRIDQAINPFIDPERYYACADPDSDDFVEGVMTPTLIFANGDDITGKGIPASIPVNCFQNIDPESGLWVAMGLDEDGTLRVVEGNNAGRNTSFITLTAAGDIDAWFTVDMLKDDFPTDGTKDDYDDSDSENIVEAYKGSTGLYRVYSDASSGLIQMSVVGSQGMGEAACGMRVMTDGVFLYFNGNINSSRGGCYDGDVQHAGLFDEDLVEFEVCIKVDGDDFEFKEDLTDCENRGIAPVAIDGSSENVTVDELFDISLITREEFKPYNVTSLFNQAPTLAGTTTTMTDTGYVEVLPPVADSATLDGYIRGDLFFRVDSSPDAAATGFCADVNVAGENPDVPVAARVLLKGSDFSQEELDHFNNSPIRQIVTEITSGYRIAANLEYWADYDVDVAAGVVDSSPLISWNNQTTPSDRKGIRLVHELQPSFTLAADDEIEITLDGDTKYGCNPQEGNRVAIARPNLGRSSLRYFRPADGN